MVMSYTLGVLRSEKGYIVFVMYIRGGGHRRMLPGRKRIISCTWAVLGRRRGIVVYIECTLTRSKDDSL